VGTIIDLSEARVGASRGKSRNTPSCICVWYSNGERQGNRETSCICFTCCSNLSYS